MIIHAVGDAGDTGGVGAGHWIDDDGIAVRQDQALPDNQNAVLAVQNLIVVAADEARTLGNKRVTAGDGVVHVIGDLADDVARKIAVAPAEPLMIRGSIINRAEGAERVKTAGHVGNSPAGSPHRSDRFTDLGGMSREKEITGNVLPPSTDRIELPPVLLGHVTPEVRRRVERFYASVADLFEAWVARRRSPYTQRAYRQDINGFIKFMRLEWPKESWRMYAVSVKDVQAFREHLIGRGAAPKTLNRRISSLSSFYKFLAAAAAELRVPITVPIAEYIDRAGLTGGPLFRPRASSNGDKLADRPLVPMGMYHVIMRYEKDREEWHGPDFCTFR